MSAFCLSFASLVAATWVLFADYVLVEGPHTVWPGELVWQGGEKRWQ